MKAPRGSHICVWASTTQQITMYGLIGDWYLLEFQIFSALYASHIVMLEMLMLISSNIGWNWSVPLYLIQTGVEPSHEWNVHTTQPNMTMTYARLNCRPLILVWVVSYHRRDVSQNVFVYSFSCYDPGIPGKVFIAMPNNSLFSSTTRPVAASILIFWYWWYSYLPRNHVKYTYIFKFLRITFIVILSVTITAYGEFPLF